MYFYSAEELRELDIIFYDNPFSLQEPKKAPSPERKSHKDKPRRSRSPSPRRHRSSPSRRRWVCLIVFLGFFLFISESFFQCGGKKGLS